MTATQELQKIKESLQAGFSSFYPLFLIEMARDILTRKAPLSTDGSLQPEQAIAEKARLMLAKKQEQDPVKSTRIAHNLTAVNASLRQYANQILANNHLADATAPSNQTETIQQAITSHSADEKAINTPVSLHK